MIKPYWSEASLIFYMILAMFVYLSVKNCVYQKIWTFRIGRFHLINNKMWWLCLMLLTFFASFRMVNSLGIGGMDAYAYITRFLTDYHIDISFSEIVTLQQTEPLFYWISHIIRKITDNYHVFFMVIYAFISSSMTIFICYFLRELRKQCSIVIYPILLMVISYFHSYNIIRFYFALSFFLLGCIFYDKCKKIHCAIFFVLAFLTHYTVIVGIMCLVVHHVVKNSKINNKIHMRFTMILFSVTGIIAVKLMLSLARIWLKNSKYAVYFDMKNTITGQLPTILLTVIILFFYDDISKVMHERIWLIDTVFINFMLLPLTTEFGFFRLGLIFLFIRIIVWCCILGVILEKFRQRRPVKLIMAIVFFAWFIFRITQDAEVSGYMPYLMNFENTIS